MMMADVTRDGDNKDDYEEEEKDDDGTLSVNYWNFLRGSGAIDSGEPRVEINLARDAVVIDVIYQLPFHSIKQFGNLCCQEIEIIQNK